MRIGILQFPGSNCERETILAVQRAGMEAVECLWNESPDKLQTWDGFVIVGGFSYEDRSRAGIIAALQPIMDAIKVQAAMGKPVLGICNGAQILVETGLVPGTENLKLALALTENKRLVEGKILGTGYYNAWVNMRLAKNYQRNAFTRYLNSQSILRLPVAHGEGRFVISPMLLQEIMAQGQHVFQYCDAAGNVDEHFPTNPNGSIANIAAISNKQGNVLAIMPHPERTKDCDPIFQSMRDYIADGCPAEKTGPLNYYPRINKIPVYQPANCARELIVELIITDNQAKTVQATLRKLGFRMRVTRRIHWEIECENETVLALIKKSGVLFNDRKEKETILKPTALPTTQAIHTLLVRSKDDWMGKVKLQIFKDHFGLQGINALRYGVLWQLENENGKMNAVLDGLLNTHILFNHYAHDCYEHYTGSRG